MIGRTLGHYRVLEKLGEGGMGVVYKAQDLHLERVVALKVLPAEKVTDPQRKARFVQEAKAASALNHPHIVHIYDIDQAEGVDFMAMEHVAGKTLDQTIPRKGMRLNEALKYAVQMADALARAHAAGILHRDFKPGNVMVTDEGQIKVLDFGLAKLTEVMPVGDDEPTRTMKPATEEGTIVGTVAYMAPEQAEGKKVDARADIFSFGTVLYEMVTGCRAFQGDTRASTLAAVLKEEPTPAGQIASGLPREVERLIRRCLHKDPAHRFQHMDDLKVALEELKDDSESGALAAVTAPTEKRRRTWAAIALAAVVVALAAAAWLWLGRARQAAPEAPLAAVPLTSFPGQEVSPSFSPDGNQVAFAWDGENGSNFDIYIRTVGTGDPLQRTKDKADDFSPAWSPDGKQIAFLRNLGSNRLAVMLMPPVSGVEYKLSDVQSGVGNYSGQVTLAWHPDGTHLVVTDAGALCLLSTETRDKRRLTTPPPGYLDRHPAFSSDGRRLAFARGTYASDLYLLTLDANLAPQGEPTALTTGMGAAAHPVWTADDREIVFSAGTMYSPSLWRLTLAGPRTPRRMTSAGEVGLQPAISRDGRRLAYSRLLFDAGIYRLGVSGGEATETLPARHIASTYTEYGPQFSPDGTKVAFESNRSGNTEIWVCDSDGLNAVQVTTMGGPLTGTPRWCPDGQQIVFDSRPQGHADIFVVAASGGKPRPVTTDPSQESMPWWSRDGQWIYFTSSRTGRNEVWKTTAGGTFVPEHADQVTHNGGSWVRESPDGTFLYYLNGGALWRMPVDGGEEMRVVEGASSSYAVTDTGIYFIPSSEAAIRFLDLTTKAVRTVAVLDRLAPYGLTVSPDGRTLLFAQIDNWDSDLMLVDGFR